MPFVTADAFYVAANGFKGHRIFLTCSVVFQFDPFDINLL